MKKLLQLFLFLALVSIASAQFSASTLFVGTADATCTNTTTETSLVTSTGVGSTLIPVNYLYPGRTLSIIIRGYYSTLAVTPGTLTIKIKLGSTVVTSVAASNLIGSVTNKAFAVSFTFTCRTNGVSGTVDGGGALTYGNLTGLLSPDGVVMTSVATINTTTTQQLDITAQWGTANAANAITINTALFEAWN